MQQSIRILCDIYNFIGIGAPPTADPNMKAIEQFRQIYLLVNELVTSEYMHPHNIFGELCLFINKEEEVFGPKKFRKMIESISSIIFEFVAGRLRAGNADVVVLCLTYYSRYCQRHFTLTIRALIAILHTLTHFQKNTVEIAQNYIAQARQLLKTIAKDPQEAIISANLKVMLNVLEGIACLRRQNSNRAKFIFSETIGLLTQRMHKQQSKAKHFTPETAAFFTVATYFLAKAYGNLGQHDREAYHVTQCMEFASTHIPNHQFLLEHLATTHRLMQSVVKLGRTQNKIQRIKSLHNFQSRSRQVTIATKENSKAVMPQFKISKKTREIKINEGTIRHELQNLLILEQENQARLKKKTLNELYAQKIEKQRKIQNYQQQIVQFQQEKTQISHKYPNEQYCAQIKQKMNELNSVKSDISNKIWDVVSTLKPTKRIGNYLLGFVTMVTYQKTNNFIKFLYNQVSFSSHLKLYSILRKIRSRLIRQDIKQVRIGNVLHQVELSRHKIDYTCHMKIYQVQKGKGLNIEQEVTAEAFESLKTKPFCFNFHIQEGNLVPFQKYLESLSPCLLIKVKLFFLKLKKRAQTKQKRLRLRKKQVNITFGTYYNQLKYLVFVASHSIENGQYLHTVQRIDTTKYHNPDYNIKISQSMTTKSLQVCDFQLSQLITNCILAQKEKHVHIITRIQQMFRFKLAHLQLIKRKENVQVNTLIIQRSIFSLVVNGCNRTFFIENLDGKFPMVKLANASFYNLSFVHKIRNELMASSNCQQQMAMINKYFRLRNFAYKFIKKSQQVKLDTKFSTKFKKSLCFAKVMKQYLYHGKLIEGRMMYMLTVKDFGAFPRPYLLRVFTIQHKSLYSVDCEQVIFNSEKIYLESNLDRINHFLDIQDHRRVTILDGPYKPMSKMKRQNSKSTLVSNFSFGNSEEFLKERNSRLGSRLLHARQTNLNNRNKKNSINFKMRHKSALKQKDILLIKKWIEDSKEDSSISESQESSTT